MANYRVLKQFSGDRLFKVGETVSLDGRNVEKLIDMRYLALDGDSAPAPTPAPTPPVAGVDAPQTAPKRRGRGRPRKAPQTPDAALAPV